MNLNLIKKKKYDLKAAYIVNLFIIIILFKDIF